MRGASQFGSIYGLTSCITCGREGDRGQPDRMYLPPRLVLPGPVEGVSFRLNDTASSITDTWRLGEDHKVLAPRLDTREALSWSGAPFEELDFNTVNQCSYAIGNEITSPHLTYSGVRTQQLGRAPSQGHTSLTNSMTPRFAMLGRRVLPLLFGWDNGFGGGAVLTRVVDAAPRWPHPPEALRAILGIYYGRLMKLEARA